MVETIKKWWEELFTPPKFYFENLFEEANYIITYRFLLFLTIALTLLGITLIIANEPTNYTLTFVAVIFSYYSLLNIKRTGIYKKTAFIVTVLYALIIEISLFLIPQNPHIIEGLWMVNNVFFAFLAVGKRCGLAIAIVHGLSMSSHYLLIFENKSDFLPNYDYQLSEIIGICLNIFSAFSVLIYFSHETIKTNKRASDQLKASAAELKNQLETINQQNQEKSVLLKEIHHRVKNNLQLIISLLRLQSREIKDEVAIGQFNEAINRIIAISLVHEKMYQSEDLSRLNLETYFTDISNDLLISTLMSNKVKVNIDFHVEKLRLKPIVPLALIFNELLSNSIKHNAENDTTLSIHVSMRQDNSKYLLFEYSDNGEWKTPMNANSFGLELIEALVQQINGTIHLETNPHTKYTIHFQNIK
jgi:two-component sensor histidine kinase